MNKINNEQEKNDYFALHIKDDEAYFNVKYLDGDSEFIYMRKFEDWGDDGSDWYLESPTELRRYDLSGVDLTPYYDEEEDETYIPFEWCYIKDGFAYENNSWQTSPFLPEEFEIEFVTDDNIEAIKYMLKRNER